MKSWLLFLLFVVGVNAEAKNLQDPTRPTLHQDRQNANIVREDAQVNELRLTAIMITEQHKQAIINGQSVQEGQRLQNYQVVSITQHRVVLSGVDGEQTLIMNKNNVKKDINNDF